MTTTINLPSVTGAQVIRPVAASTVRQPIENARSLTALLLAAAVAALAVVADQLVDTWVDGHLMLAWIVMWAVVFVGSLLLTGTIRRVSQRLVIETSRWVQIRREMRELIDAMDDPRVKAEVLAAAARE